MAPCTRVEILSQAVLENPGQLCQLVLVPGLQAQTGWFQGVSSKLSNQTP